MPNKPDIQPLIDALAKAFLNGPMPLDFRDKETGKTVIPASKAVTITKIRKMAQMADQIETDPSPIQNLFTQIVARYKRPASTRAYSSTIAICSPAESRKSLPIRSRNRPTHHA